MSKLANLYSRRYQDYLNQKAPSRETVGELIKQNIHGLCFSPYVEGQGPGTELSEQQVVERLSIIAKHTGWIRSFSCTEGNEHIPVVAKRMGLKTMVGIWLDEDLEHNELEMAKGIELAKAGYADLVAVGNEVLLREELSEQQLIDYMNRVREAAPGVPVGYVDAYYLFENHRAVTDACDVVFANCYPFWEGYSIEHAHVYMKDMYYRAKAVAGERPVIISETGWPNLGTAEGNAVPSEENAIRYFTQTYQWANQLGVEVFYFAALDEAWKVEKEGDVGAYWGLWDKDGKPKYWDE
ncbi:glycosyl hydrolase family 17 protein [Aestuariibacter salexigens]|uniref:glycoside hydrolase family 17 protein n=1 Tax=Aestuariibacter salexigens TaxID=226010 RepID=UPI0003F57A0B|nr:glycosyl hydrolase family 17 protein [Aestuariibacter salexigens]